MSNSPLLFSLSREESPTEAEFEVLGQGIQGFNIENTGESTEKQRITYFIRNKANEIIAGVSGTYNNYGWLYINGLWVSKPHRHQRLATQLMDAIESEAKQKGCSDCYLYTLSFQAPEFYAKMGFKQFAELQDYHQGYSKIFLVKAL